MGKVSTMFPKFEQRRKRVGLNEKKVENLCNHNIDEIKLFKEIRRRWL